jgi:hypothetical protein
MIQNLIRNMNVTLKISSNWIKNFNVFKKIYNQLPHDPGQLAIDPVSNRKG